MYTKVKSAPCPAKLGRAAVGEQIGKRQNDRSTNPIVLEHKQVLIRGASTVTVPNSVWMVSVRQSH